MQANYPSAVTFFSLEYVLKFILVVLDENNKIKK